MNPPLSTAKTNIHSWRWPWYSWLTLFTVCLSLSLSLMASAQSAPEDHSQPTRTIPLPVESAIYHDLQLDQGRLILNFELIPGIYLYRKHLQIQALHPEQAISLRINSWPKTQIIHDEIFDENLEVYYQSLQLTIDIISTGSLSSLNTLSVALTYLSCDEIVKICYPPQEHLYTFDLNDTANYLVPPAKANIDASGSWFKLNNWVNSILPETFQQSNQISDYLKSNPLWLILLVFFMLGLLLSLTPCVLPMIPVLLGIIAQNKTEQTKTHNLLTAFFFAAGMISVFTILGLIAGLSGKWLSIYFTHPAVITGTAILLMLLAFINLPLPLFNLPRLPQGRRTWITNNSTGIFILGGTSSILLSPCVSAPLIGILLYLSATNNALLGAISLFTLALGMSVILFVCAWSFNSKPLRTGAWMAQIKNIFVGLLMLSSAYFILPLMPTWGILILVATCGALMILAIATTKSMQPNSISHRLQKILCLVILTVYLTIPLYETLSQSTDQTAATNLNLDANQTNSHSSLGFNTTISSQASLQELAQTSDKPLLVYYWASWCVSCRIWEGEIFPHPQVQAQLSSFNLIKADVSDSFAKPVAQLLQQNTVFGPPAVLLFKPQNSTTQDLQYSQRIDGTIDPTIFAKFLNQFTQEHQADQADQADQEQL